MRQAKVGLSALLILAFGCHSWGFANGAKSDLRRRLGVRVGNFDNKGRALTATLLQIAADYNLPMGIEKVTPDALHKTIEVKMQAGTVSGLLDLCLKQLPDYSWSVLAGAVLVYGPDEREQPSNLLNLVIPAFAAKDSTIGHADWRLRNDLDVWAARAKYGWKPGAKSKGAFVPGGIEGSYLVTLELEKKRISFSVHHAPVREILNRMVALHDGAVWVAIVYPRNLSEAPGSGLWALLPRGDVVLTDQFYERQP
jgi:hypothetical protein